MNKYLFFLLTFFSFSVLLKAQQQEQPKIALVLGGGGTKGITHIGVIQVLEEAGIRPDYITGTSIGSIIGGLYAIGYSPAELEAFALGLDWAYFFSDELKRTDLPIEERQFSDKYQLRLEIKDKAIQLPKGFIQGQKIGLLLSKLTLPAHGIYDFDDFDIPFRCVATNVETGEAVVLSKGQLAKAMRASMSLPSVFEPVELDGKLLIDGGVVQNLPVQEALDMGADIIIAVDITSPLYVEEDLNSLLQVLVQTGTYGLVRSVNEQKKLADVVISPNIEGFGTLDFDKGDSLLQLGRAAALEVLPDIMEKVGTRNDAPSKGVDTVDIGKITNVEWTNIDEEEQRGIINIFDVRKDKTYSLEEIEARFQQLFGSRFFQDAYYELLPTEEDYELRIDAAVKSGDYLKLSVNYDSDLKAALLMNATFRNKKPNGEKFSLDFKLSEFPMILAHYQIYSAAKPNLGLRLTGKLNHYPLDFYDMDRNVEEITGLYHYRLQLDFLANINNNSLITSGISVERYAQRERFFEKDSEVVGTNQFVAQLQYLRDTYNRKLYPNEGAYFSIDGQFAFSSKIKYPLEGQADIVAPYRYSARMQYSRVFPLEKKLAIEWYNDAGIVGFQESDLPNNYLNLFYLGRQLPEEQSHVEFFGLDYMEVPVSAYLLSGLRFRAEVRNNIFGSVLLNYAQYEAQTYQRFIDGETEIIPSDSGGILGLGLELGFLSPIGPGRFSTEFNLTEGMVNFALHLGYVF